MSAHYPPQEGKSADYIYYMGVIQRTCACISTRRARGAPFPRAARAQPYALACNVSPYAARKHGSSTDAAITLKGCPGANELRDGVARLEG
eukprot:scaffold58694_cov67-Phaeocystis_antarctica.AAC.1